MSQHRFVRSVSFLLSLTILGSSFSIANAQNIKRSLDDYKSDDRRDRAVTDYIHDVRSATLQDLHASQFEIDAAQSARVVAWFDANNYSVASAIDKTFRSEAGKRLDGYMKKPDGASAPAGSGGISLNDNVFLRNAAYRPSDDIPVTTVETDEGLMSSASVEKTTNVGQVQVKHGAAGNTRVIAVEGGNVGSETKSVEYTETFDPVKQTRVRSEVTMNWHVTVPSCPDASGIVAGTGKMTVNLVTTITTRETIAILRRETTTLLNIKGHVNDDAMLTHYDMKGTAMQAVSGYDRAAWLGLSENSIYKDGTQAIDYNISNSKIGTQVTGPSGYPKTVGEAMGEVRVNYSPDMISAADVERLENITGKQVGMINNDTVMFLTAAQANWRNYGCVEIKMTPAKLQLRPAEQVSVSTETVHKFDKAKVNANLSASGTASVTPEKVFAEPQVSHTLTAPAKGSKAQLIVTSTSRRGIALEILDFEEEKSTKPTPPKTKPPIAKKCDGGWTGKITAVKTKRTEIAKPASGRLVRQIENVEETFSVDYHVLGTRDTSEGFSNAFLSDAQMNYRAVEYRESNYAPGKMSCNNVIITSPHTLKIESLTSALSHKQITVYITSTGEMGSLTFGSPEIEAERVITRTYESACERDNQMNSGVDRSDTLIEVPSPGFEISFELDAKIDRVLKGSKRIENADGSYTVVTWDLTRNCP